MAVPKRQDWERRLAEYIISRLRSPFVWGQHDCCLFACDGIGVQYDGVDIAAGFRGKYSTAAGAVRLVQEHTGGGDLGSLVDIVVEQWGVKEVQRNEAKRGDLCLFPGTFGPTLGLVDFDGKNVLAPGEHALASCPMQWEFQYWRLD